MAQLDEIGAIEGAGDLPASHKREPFHSLKVGTLDRENLLLRQRLGVIVDQLSVYKSVDVMCSDLSLSFFPKRQIWPSISMENWLSMRVLTRSARSNFASFPMLSTLTRAPKILILSVSTAENYN